MRTGSTIVDAIRGGPVPREWVRAPATDSGAGAAQALRRALRVLIVEDEAITAMNLENTVGELGHEVVGTAATGPAAVTAAAAHLPDVVLMDVRLAEGTDGIAAATEIRHRLGIPSIFLTAHSDPATRRRADAAGGVGYAVKPFSTEQIAALLDRVSTDVGGAGG